ncbi:MAG: hypothetical protein JWP29_611, partial [Rhodoferax sp.]|nr:hypothetical protein [Rhodoferax sp.]
MKSTIISAAVLAAAAFASVDSFADGINAKAPPTVSSTATKTRADVRSELVQAQRNGLSLTINNSYPGAAATHGLNTRSRDDVRADVAAAGGASLNYDG